MKALLAAIDTRLTRARSGPVSVTRNGTTVSVDLSDVRSIYVVSDNSSPIVPLNPPSIVISPGAQTPTRHASEQTEESLQVAVRIYVDVYDREQPIVGKNSTRRGVLEIAKDVERLLDDFKFRPTDLDGSAALDFDSAFWMGTGSPEVVSEDNTPYRYACTARFEYVRFQHGA